MRTSLWMSARLGFYGIEVLGVNFSIKTRPSSAKNLDNQNNNRTSDAGSSSSRQATLV